MNTKKLNVYFDMDDVLANFSGEPDGNFYRKGFFRNLKPMQKNVEAVRKAIRKGLINAYIISLAPNQYAEMEKRQWLVKYLPEIKPENVEIQPIGSHKADFMKTTDGILFDDWDKNLVEWCLAKSTNRAVKIEKDGDVADGLMLVRLNNKALIRR